MTRGRAAPPRQPTRQELEHAERRAALLSLDPSLMRTWARAWGVPILPTDDAGLLVSMHETRMRDLSLPMEARLHSMRWLAERGDQVALAAVAELETKEGTEE